MVSFRREKKKQRMEERAAEGVRAGEREPERAAEGFRVNDRRRSGLHETGEGEAPAEEARGAEPSLKPSYVEELEARARAAEQKASDAQSRFEQVRAELRRETDEIRQRLARTSDERVAREKASFIAALLPTLDNLQRAVEAAEGGGTKEALVEGLRGTISGFENSLAASGVEPVEAAGQPFDPELHEAVDTAEVGPERDGAVTAQYSRGYRIGNQLLRPARVQVGRASAEARGAETS
jgi:molecular chaperone GrpE